jgi:alginate O-acetyltransferase complex protein AlgI
MVFSSSVFLFVFLPVVLTLYLLSPRALRNVVLLVASLFFYAWGEKFFVFVMLASIAVNYGCGLLIDRLREGVAGKWMLGLAVAWNLGLLGFYKYANFLVDNLNVALAAVGVEPWALDPVHLPIGISFFTFQALSYVIDVYRRDAVAERNPITIALYIALFPQLIAGPIVRYRDVAFQLLNRVTTVEGIASGSRLFLIGLGKKMLIANPMGEVADAIFAIPHNELTPAVAWTGVICYSLQIYFDFSGYSDMAIGLGRILGFRFLRNFNYPYISLSIREFWRRWHISLSRWFRDYLYVPLGGNRVGPWRVYLNLVTVFFLCGLWHGASWTFVIWGLIHGFFLAFERLGFDRVLARLWRPLRRVYVLGIVTVSWVFFRAEDFETAKRFLLAMAGRAPGSYRMQYPELYLNNQSMIVIAIAMVAATPLLPRLIRRLHRWRRGEAAIGAGAGVWLWRAAAVLGVVGLGLILLGSSMHLALGTHNPFIYFRF